jgi:hypothetical protein
MSDQKQLPLDCQQSKMTLKALRAEAKRTGVKNYSKLSRDFLIEAIAKQTEQNNISDAIALFPDSPANKETETKDVFDTETPEAKGQPEPVPAVTTIPPPVTPEKKERKTRKKKSKEETAPAGETAPAPKKKGPNKWQLHVQTFRSEHPELSYKQAMTEAKATYQA